MRITERRSENPSDLMGVIHQIRRRWRYKLMLRGAVGVLGLGAAALVFSAWGLESWRFSPASIITFRVLIAIAFASLVGWFIVRPLLWHVSDEQVALYLEEHEPSLQAEIISAIEASRLAASDNSPHSQVLVRRLIESAVAKCEAIDWGRNVERQPLRRHATTFAVIAVAAIALFTLGPRFLRHGLSAIFVMSRSVEAAAPYRIEVSPGNASVPRGVDQTITATLGGFDADQASLMIRKTPEAPFERVPLVRSENPNEANKYEGMLFDLAAPIEYFVEAEGVKSAIYTLKVVDLPYVQRLELELHFPAYTGLAPRKVEDGGDLGRPQGDGSAGQGHADHDGARGADSVPGRAEGAPDGGGRQHPDRDLQGGEGRVLPLRARRAVGRARVGVAAVHDRCADRSGTVGFNCQAGPRYQCVADRGSVRRSPRGRRLRREGSRAGLLDQRRGREVDPSVRRQESARGGDRRPYVLSRGAERQGRGFRVLLRARRRQRHEWRQTADERYLFPPDSSAAQGVQARRV